MLLFNSEPINLNIMKPISLIVILLLTRNLCKSQNCADLPQHYSSYAQAISSIKKASFAFTDVANTTKSSWIRAACYYSCDGETGYLIFATDKQEYIHENVPINVWIEFKNAESSVWYYDRNIKYRYRMSFITAGRNSNRIKSCTVYNHVTF